MEDLRTALEAMKASKGGAKETANAAAALLHDKIYAPATWDKQPIEDGHGQLVFPQGTSVQITVLEAPDHTCWFPFFTSQEAVAKWNPTAQSLVLTFDQFMNFVHMAEKDINGIILDVKDLNIRMDNTFLAKLETLRKQKMTVGKVQKGEKVTVAEPGILGEHLSESLAETAATMPEIQTIVLKQRQMPDNTWHWLAIVDSTLKNPDLFKKLARQAAPYAMGKGIEFMFGDTALGQKILEASQPIYTKQKN